MKEESENYPARNTPSYKNREIPKIITISFLSFYSLSVIYLVFFARRRRHLTSHHVNFIPFQNILESTKNMSSDGLYNYYSNLIGNILLFIPFPFVLILCFRIYKSSSIFLSGLLLSFIIELLQYIFMVGVSDIDDIILNTFGTFTGLVCFKFFEKIQLL